MNNKDMSAMPYATQRMNNQFGGLTKREMFAMNALNSVLSMFNPYEQGNFDSSDYQETAKYAVGLADALLEELEKSN